MSLDVTKTSGRGNPLVFNRTSASRREHDVTIVHRPRGSAVNNSSAPGSGTTPSRSVTSSRSISWFSATGSTFGRYSRTVVMLGRPCARCTTSAASNPCRAAQRVHTRATAGVESTSTPSISKSTPAQEIRLIHNSARARSNNHSFSRAQESIQHTDAQAFPQFDGLDFARRTKRKDLAPAQLIRFFRRVLPRHLSRGDPNQRGQHIAKTPAPRRSAKFEIQSPVQRVQLVVNPLRLFLRMKHDVRRTNLLLRLFDRLERPRRQKRKYRGPQASHFLARHQHRTAQHIRIHLIQNRIALRNPSRIDHPLDLRAIFSHAIQ